MRHLAALWYTDCWLLCIPIRPHTSAYVSIRQHTSVSIRNMRHLAALWYTDSWLLCIPLFNSICLDVCWRMLTYADVCRRMLTYADLCWRIIGHQTHTLSLSHTHTHHIYTTNAHTHTTHAHGTFWQLSRAYLLQIDSSQQPESVWHTFAYVSIRQSAYVSIRQHTSQHPESVCLRKLVQGTFTSVHLQTREIRGRFALSKHLVFKAYGISRYVCKQQGRWTSSCWGPQDHIIS
jgi:hypothetical protein